MFVEKYTLILPFILNDNSSISIKNNQTFILEKYNVEINLTENHEGNFKIYYFENQEDIFPFYNNFKKIISLLNLDAGLWSIKLKELNNIKEYVKKNHIIDKSKINRNTIYFIPEITTELPCTLKATPIQVKSSQKISDKIKFYYSKRDSLDFDKNKKLKPALSLYSDSYFKDSESRFLIYMTILELLKPSIKRKGIGKECAKKIKSVVKEYKDSAEVKVDGDLKNEINEIEGSLNFISDRSIRYSLLHLANENNIEVNGYDLHDMIIKSYKVRNKYVHEGKIKDEFGECLDFLTKFVPKLLKMEINKMINQ